MTEASRPKVECPLFLARIGNTPPVPLLSPNQRVQVLGKVEWFNPISNRIFTYIFPLLHFFKNWRLE